MTKEKWKPIKFWEQYYQVSNLGNIRSIDREIINNGTPVLRKGRVLKPSFSKQSKYAFVSLRVGDLREMVFYHRCVALHFVKNPNKKRFNDIEFIDGNILNYCASNLKWCTRSDVYKKLMAVKK